MELLLAENLMLSAVEARKNSYAPYSDFHVGAALLGASGKVYLGCNVENAAYTPTNCAERTALFSAVASGEKEFVALAVVGGRGEELAPFTAPCGVCRQVLAEFCGGDFEVILGKPGAVSIVTLAELLPYSFSPKDLS